jgi:hypothetical protein
VNPQERHARREEARRRFEARLEEALRSPKTRDRLVAAASSKNRRVAKQAAGLLARWDAEYGAPEHTDQSTPEHDQA